MELLRSIVFLTSVVNADHRLGKTLLTFTLAVTICIPWIFLTNYNLRLQTHHWHGQV